eukprot:337591-Pleurochrysis_carterae.AAC.2
MCMKIAFYLGEVLIDRYADPWTRGMAAGSRGLLPGSTRTRDTQGIHAFCLSAANQAFGGDSAR